MAIMSREETLMVTPTLLQGIKKGKGKRGKKRVVSSEEEIDSSTDDSSDIEEPLDPEIFDCIEVAEQN